MDAEKIYPVFSLPSPLFGEGLTAPDIKCIPDLHPFVPIVFICAFFELLINVISELEKIVTAQQVGYRDRFLDFLWCEAP